MELGGMTHQEMTESMSAQEFAHWVALRKIHIQEQKQRDLDARAQANLQQRRH
jgi:hypothetical protein